MPKKLYDVQLTKSERTELEQLLRHGQQSARGLTRARILLLADEQCNDEEIMQALNVSRGTIYRIRRRYCQEGLQAALQEKPRPGVPPKVDSRLEAHVTMVACSEAPDGYGRWTVRLLADRLVELGYVDSISHMTVQRLLKKTSSSRG